MYGNGEKCAEKNQKDHNRQFGYITIPKMNILGIVNLICRWSPIALSWFPL